MENLESLVDTKNDNILFKVYIKKVPLNFNQEKLLQLFSPFGDPFKIYIDPTKWAMVFFGTYEEANHSINSLNNAPPLYLEVRFATPPTYEMNYEEMLKMQEKLSREAEKLHLKEVQILLKMKNLECQVLMAKLNTDGKKDNLNNKKFDSLSNEENIDILHSFDSSSNNFVNDINGDIKPDDYANSNYRNICEIYMSSWIKRFLEDRTFQSTRNSEEKINKNQVHQNGIKNLPPNKSTQIRYDQHSQNTQLKQKKYNFEQKGCIKDQSDKEINQEKNFRKTNNIKDFHEQKKIDQMQGKQSTIIRGRSQIKNNTNVNLKKSPSNNFQKNSESMHDETWDTNCKKLPVSITTPSVSIFSKADKEQLNKFTVSKQNGYSYIELPSQEFTEVKVEWMESDSEGWVSLVLNENIIENIVLELNNNIGPLISNPEVGLLCSAIYIDVWCRAVVLSTVPDITVHYIDYGNTEKVKIPNLRELPAELKNIPGLVVHIRLADGSIDKISNEKKLVVKPVTKEGNLTICHVQGGFYPINEPKHIEAKKISCSSKDPLITSAQKSVVQLLKTEYTGILTLKSEIEQHKFTAIIYPCDLLEVFLQLKALGEHDFDMIQEKIVPNVGDMVMVRKGNVWMRGCVLNQQSDEAIWHVALVDEALVQNVTEIKKILPPHAVLPEFACCLIVNDLFTDIKDFERKFQLGERFHFKVLEVLEDYVICILTSSETKDPICKIKVTHWNYKSLIKQESRNLQPVIELNTIPIVSESIVRIILPISQQKLLIQNKEAATAMKNLVRQMKSLSDNFKPLSRPPIVGEILASRFSEDQLWYRVKIKDLDFNNTYALVKFLDYENEERVSVKNLRVLPQVLLDIPCCLIPIKLQGLPNKPFNTAQKTEFDNCIKNHTNFIVKCDSSFDEGITLYSPNNTNFNNLIMELGGHLKTASVVSNFEQSSVLKEIKSVTPVKDNKTPHQSPILNTHLPNIESMETDTDLHIDSMQWSLGKAEIVFIDFFVLSCGMIVCILHDEQVLESVQKINEKIIKSIESKSPEHFTPEEGDTCLAKYKGVWYRALCLNKSEDEVLVLYVDYGNTETIPYTDIGKITEDLIQQPSVAMICSLFDDDTELDEKQKNVLESELEPNHVYDCEIVSEIEPGRYRIKLPHIDRLF